MLDERGLNDSLQWAILTPVLMLVVLGTLEVGLWAHGRTVAAHAAIAAAESGARLGSGPGDAESLATRIARDGGLTDAHVGVRRTPNAITVVVDGRMPTLVDLGLTRVSEQATRPVERVTQP